MNERIELENRNARRNTRDLRALVALVGIVAVAAASAPAGHTAARGAAITEPGAVGHVIATPPVVGHVFTLVLENESFERSFGRGSKAPYLASTLPAHGALLTHYYGVGHNSLDNYIGMISGQAPNEATQRDCPIFSNFALARPALDAHGQAIGTGCVYPAMVKTIADQLEASGRTWRGYMEDMGNDPAKEHATCGHPPIGDTDNTTKREPGDQYATKHNPFVYFHTVLDNPARCNAHVVNLRQLTTDLASAATTPNYVFITPNLCNDGHDGPCIDHAPGGLVQIDQFLRKWVPAITASPAFAQDGVLIITFDEASGPPGQDSSACCGELPLPGQHQPPGGDGPGGGRVGAVIISPFVKGGTVTDQPYNHYSMLRWVEDQFGLPHLGYAAEPGLAVFGTDVFNQRAAR
jgi:phosphatidylinositol-3-phosphatase